MTIDICLSHVHRLNPFASGIKKVLLYPITGLFSVKIRKKNSSH